MAREDRVNVYGGSSKIPVRDSTREIFSKGSEDIAKAVFDRTAAALIFLAVLPVFATVILAMRLWDRGPVFYGHRRLGRNAVLFDCLKFRTMVVDAEDVLERHLRTNPDAEREWLATRKLKDDPRVTTLGRFLRKTSLDELPQLINILRGEMSLVGPRPIVEAEVPYYAEVITDYLEVRPGLTGLWQISGRNDIDYAERIRLDQHYVRNRSLRRDVTILLRTAVVVLRQKGSY